MNFDQQIKKKATALGLCLCIGCGTYHKAIPVTNSSDYLNRNQIVFFTQQAQLGDGNAAFKLSNYYEFWVYDTTNAFKWLCIAATNGNAAGEYNLGQYYSEKSNPSSLDIKNAKYWFGRLAAKGDSDAIIKLSELDGK